MPSTEPLGGLEQQLATLVGSRAPRIARLDEPIDQELDLDVLHAVVVENPPHLGQRVPCQDALEIRMPEAYALEAGTRGSLDALAELECAVLEAGVRQSAPGERPVGGNQLDGGTKARGAAAAGASANRGIFSGHGYCFDPGRFSP